MIGLLFTKASEVIEVVKASLLTDCKSYMTKYDFTLNTEW